MARYQPPTPITSDHELDEFSSGQDSLDRWLRDHALNNEGRTSRSYVVEAGSDGIVAYYALVTGSVERAALKSKMRHGAPDPVPVMVLARLAVDQRHHGAGLGAAMLRDAMLRTLEVSRVAGVRMMIVHAIDEAAAAIYRRYGFEPLPREPHTLFLPIETIVDAL